MSSARSSRRSMTSPSTGSRALGRNRPSFCGQRPRKGFECIEETVGSGRVTVSAHSDGRGIKSKPSRARAISTPATHRGFAWLIVASASIMVVCSAFVYQAEHGVNKLLASPFDALWWGVTTLTTVGYGDSYPVTQDGRLGAMLLMLLGIGLFSAITATITSYFISQETP